jgi:hypothetical protein
VSWTVRFHPGSALRLSQPLSGFPAGLGFVALFRATTVPGILPSELLPHRDRPPLSRPSFEVACSPAVVHQWSEARRSSPFALGFIDSHAFTRLPESPQDYGLPFRGPRSSFRSSRALCGGAHLSPPASPTSEPSSPCETVPATSGYLCRWPFLSWSFPLRSFPFHTSDPRPARTSTCLGTLPRPKTRVRDSKDH